MKIAIVGIAHIRAALHYDRFVMSLHNQSHRSWDAFIFEVSSQDRIDQLSFPISRLSDCDALKSKLNYVQVGASEFYQEVIEHVILGNDFYHAVGFVPLNYRMDYKLLELVNESFDADTQTILVEGKDFYGENSYERVPFLKRELVQNNKFMLNDSDGELWVAPKNGATKTLGQKPFLMRF